MTPALSRVRKQRNVNFTELTKCKSGVTDPLIFTLITDLRGPCTFVGSRKLICPVAGDAFSKQLPVILERTVLFMSIWKLEIGSSLLRWSQKDPCWQGLLRTWAKTWQPEAVSTAPCFQSRVREVKGGWGSWEPLAPGVFPVLLPSFHSLALSLQIHPVVALASPLAWSPSQG